MGLLRMAARTAVVAGTATAVSGRVAHRQAEKYDAQDQAAYDQQQAADAQQHAPPPPAAGRGRRDRGAPGPGAAAHPGRPHRRGVRGRQGQDPRYLSAPVSRRGVLAAGRGLRRDRRRPLPRPLGRRSSTSSGRGPARRRTRARCLLRHRAARRRAGRARLPRRRASTRPTAMLDRARGCSVPDAELVQATLPDLPVEGVFDAAVSTFDGLNYLAPDELRATLAAVAGRLRPGGWLVFDLHTDAMMASRSPSRSWPASRPATASSITQRRRPGARDVRDGARPRVVLESTTASGSTPTPTCGRRSEEPASARRHRRRVQRAGSERRNPPRNLGRPPLASFTGDGLRLHDGSGPRSSTAPTGKVLDDITLAFLPGAKIGVLGPNGAGKSTLLRIMAGLEEPSSGIAELARRARPSDSLSRSPSSTRPRTCAATSRTASATLRDLLDRFNDDLGRVRRAGRRLRRAARRAGEGAGADRPARRLEPRRRRSTGRWTRCACPSGDRDVTTLSGGERRRVALCRLLLSSPDLLLLDEPTNHLDAESVAWLERFLADYTGTVVAVTHDRYFLDNVAGWILELDRGKGIPFEGNYSGWLEQKQARLAARGEDRSRRAAARSRASSSGCASRPTARHAKSKARAQRLREAARRGAEREARPGRDPHPRRPAARRRRRRGATTSRRASATGCSSRT